MVIKLTVHEELPVKMNNVKQMFRIIKVIFLLRRKILFNTLAAHGELGIDKEKLKQLLEESGIGTQTNGKGAISGDKRYF